MSSDQPQRPTIYAVAESAGVSIATVSRVLQGTENVASSTRGKVLEAARQLDYLPRGSARALAAKKHEALGLMLPELTGPYFSELLIGFESAAADQGRPVALVMTDEPGLTEPVRRLASRVDGLALMAGREQLTCDDIGSLARRVPLVLVASGHHPGSLGTENTRRATELTEHLFGHGRRRLWFVGDPALAADATERFEGFAAAHTAAGLPVPEPVEVGFREADGRRCAERVLARRDDRPDALVCVNDEVAVAALDALQRAGVSVPDDVAVTGWDDVMTARYTRPGLTTVAQPVRELGRLAATALQHVIEGGSPAVESGVLPTRIVIRGSCGCAEPPNSPGFRGTTRHSRTSRGGTEK